jgi:hypothetical protein
MSYSLSNFWVVHGGSICVRWWNLETQVSDVRFTPKTGHT